MLPLIPDGSVFLLSGLLQHLSDSLPTKQQAILKAFEGVAKAVLAIVNFCLLYQNAVITEDIMLLKVTVYAFFFVSACVDLSLYMNLVPSWFTLAPTAVLLGVHGGAVIAYPHLPGSVTARLAYLEAVVSLMAALGLTVLVFVQAKGKTNTYVHLISHLCGFLLLLTGSWSVYTYMYVSTQGGAEDGELLWINMVFFWHIFVCSLVLIVSVAISISTTKTSDSEPVITYNDADQHLMPVFSGSTSSSTGGFSGHRSRSSSSCVTARLNSEATSTTSLASEGTDSVFTKNGASENILIPRFTTGRRYRPRKSSSESNIKPGKFTYISGTDLVKAQSSFNPTSNPTSTNNLKTSGATMEQKFAQPLVPNMYSPLVPNMYSQPPDRGVSQTNIEAMYKNPYGKLPQLPTPRPYSYLRLSHSKIGEKVIMTHL